MLKYLVTFCLSIVLCGCSDVRINTGIGMRDPFVAKIDNSYVLTGTLGDREVLAFTSPDLQNWSEPVSVFTPNPSFWGTKSTFWAPEIFEYQGGYYIFETFEDNAGKGVGTLRLNGSQFVPNSGKLTPPDKNFCIDGTLLMVGNEPWMLYTDQGIDGVLMACALNNSLSGVISPSVPIFSAVDCSWMVRHPDGRAILDGPQAFWAPNGKLYILWSTFKSGTTYCVAQTRVESINPLILTHANTPLFEDDGGHGMIFQDFSGLFWLSLHTPNRNPPYRAVFVNVVFENDWFKVRVVQ